MDHSVEELTCLALAELWDDPTQNNFDYPWDWRAQRQRNLANELLDYELVTGGEVSEITKLTRAEAQAKNYAFGLNRVDKRYRRKLF